MRWFANIYAGLAAHRQKIISALAVAVLLVAVSVWLGQIVSPYKERRQVDHAFYAVASGDQNVVLRAVVQSVSSGEARVTLQDGPQQGQDVTVKNSITNAQPGQVILVAARPDGSASSYAFSEWRIPGLLLLLGLFLALVFLVIGRRGIASVAGLFVSIIVITTGLIPAIMQGVNAFYASVIAAFVIATLSIIVAHGWRWRSVVSLMSIYIVLLLTVGLALLGGAVAYLTGVYDDTSAILRVQHIAIDLRGVLTGGIVIATLGVLDDVITAQTAAVDEIHNANPKLSIKELYRRGHSVGSEHVISLVNTLALAYAGASLPVVLAIIANANTYSSALLIFNAEFIAQEIVRTLVSSMALVAAVPIATLVAAVAIKKKRVIFAIIKEKSTRRT